MSLKIATRANQAVTLPAALVVTLVNNISPANPLPIELEDVETLDASDKSSVVSFSRNDGSSAIGSLNVIQKLQETYPEVLKGRDIQIETEWLQRAGDLTSLDFKAIEGRLLELDAHLLLRSHIVGYVLTVADLAVWGVLRGNRAAYAYLKRNQLGNVGRWFRYIEETQPWATTTVDQINSQAREKKNAKSKEGGSFEISLKDTEKGVVTRFPPEPSGYLHIGHAKAALLNDYFAHEKYKGTLICRFDDTNPSKESQEFQSSIVHDLELMGIRPDKTSHTSDYFKELHDYCIQIIKDGNAYADDTELLVMREQRMKGEPSARRNRTVEENLAAFEEMKQGTETGVKSCIRAKISVDNPNKAMRDPVIYRCNPSPHHRTGTTWKVYPTYDFACPIVDSMEGITHALRTVEYRDRNAQYDWMLQTLKLRSVHIWDFARMNFIRTLLSKRKLTKFVEQGVVWGWDDPRFPTIRGIRRRGMTIGALREFILKQGPSRNIVNLDWTIFWATNKRFIDPIAPRFTAVLEKGMVQAVVEGAPAEAYSETKPRHAKNAAVGTKTVTFSNSVVLDQDDAKTFKQDEEITLMGWGNVFVRRIDTDASGLVTALVLSLHLEGDVKKTEKKVTWLSKSGPALIPVQLVDFDYLITKDKIEEDDNVEDFLTPNTEFRTDALADHNVSELKEDDIIQFERKGYYRVDRPFKDGKRAVLFNIPTGKTK